MIKEDITMKSKSFDTSTFVVMIITMVLFVGAIFIKGITHDLLLETGVFLVSVKLMIMSYKNGKSNAEMKIELNEIKELIRNTKK
jgi:hypothetical protein